MVIISLLAFNIDKMFYQCIYDAKLSIPAIKTLLSLHPESLKEQQASG